MRVTAECICREKCRRIEAGPQADTGSIVDTSGRVTPLPAVGRVKILPVNTCKFPIYDGNAIKSSTTRHWLEMSEKTDGSAQEHDGSSNTGRDEGRLYGAI